MSSWQLFVELLQLGTNLGGIIFRSCRRHWCLSVSQFLDTASCGFCCRVSWGDFAAEWDDGTGRLGLIAVKLLIIGVFLFITGPTSTHALANAALVSGVRPKNSDDDSTDDADSA